MEPGHALASQPLITTIVASIVGAFIFGYIARKLKFPTILGYLIAGILIGPHTPGFFADTNLAMQLADIGIILLMFGVGLHFSIKDLMSVRVIASVGAVFQILFATAIGLFFILWKGNTLAEGLVFGFALSVASTVVAIRTLDQRHLLDSEGGRITVGSLVVEDILMVMALVLLPVLLDATLPEKAIRAADVALEAVAILLKLSIFAAVMVVVGRRVLPWILVQISRTKSRELTTLGTLAIALGFAYTAYTLFGASFAMGAFIAGLVLNESEIGHKAAEQSLPLRDAFAVIFFVSVGMLFNPAVLIEKPVEVVIVVAIIVLGKMLPALLVMRFFRKNFATAVLVAVSRAQIGEFSFIFAGLARSLGLLSAEMYDLILAGALLSIAINPFLFRFSGNMLKPA